MYRMFIRKTKIHGEIKVMMIEMFVVPFHIMINYWNMPIRGPGNDNVHADD